MHVESVWPWVCQGLRRILCLAPVPHRVKEGQDAQDPGGWFGVGRPCATKSGPLVRKVVLLEDASGPEAVCSVCRRQRTNNGQVIGGSVFSLDGLRMVVSWFHGVPAFGCWLHGEWYHGKACG